MFTAERFVNLYRQWDEYEVMDMFDTDSQSCLVAEVFHRFSICSYEVSITARLLVLYSARRLRRVALPGAMDICGMSHLSHNILVGS